MAKKRAPRPRLKPAQIIPKATEAVQLATEDRALIEPRLEAGMIDGASADLAQVVPAVSGAIEKRTEKKASTATQNELAGQVMDAVRTIRTALSVSGLSAAARKRYGVGLSMNARSVKTVVAGANTLLGAAAAAPEEIRSVGVLPADLEALRAALAALTGADTAQENLKIASKRSTAERDATLHRLDAAVRKIAAAGILAHAGDPARRAKYEALLASPAKAKPGGGGPAPAS